MFHEAIFFWFMKHSFFVSLYDYLESVHKVGCLDQNRTANWR